MSSEKFQTDVYPKLMDFQKKKEKKIKEAQRRKEKELSDSIVQLNYTKMWDKRVDCKTTQTFLERNERTLDSLQAKRQQVRSQKEQKREEDFSNSCTFAPDIHSKSKNLKGRNIKNWYQWQQNKIRKRIQRKQFELDQEISHCQGRFRSPDVRKKFKKDRAGHRKKYLAF